MDITCGRCRRSYFVPDDLAQARTFRAKCSQCGHAFAVEVPARARAKKKGAPPPPSDDLPSTTASAIPDLADALADTDLGWLEDAAKEADAAAADEVVLLTVRNSRRGNAVALVAGVAVVALAIAGIGAWAALRPKLPDAPARGRAHAAAEGGAAPVQDVGGLAWKAEPERPPPRPDAAAAPLAVQRAKRPRIAQDDWRLLDLLAKKQDVAVIPVEDEDAGAGSATSALDPAAAGKVMAANRKAFDACISRTLRLNPSLKLVKRTTLVVTIQPSGTVAKAYLAEEEVDRTELGACLTETARRMVFPAFDGEPLDVAMPLSLSAVF